ncbi:hypothetical protein [Sphingomonas sp. Leaf25]|uniref:hypothetical protein n=1 Tax=Sphingomonas sp. Leaf25 TaxID=1735692 RepID=UPI0006F5E797|nr:hypothetical protein [Sphingomonas sp. Leaf25]KQN01204.1 hypothetical protein ASE78_17430 [Sphingomonas sp. Leaf25]
MSSTEQVKTWFGSVERCMGKDDSSVLAQLPVGIYPNPEPACATCPAKDWYLTRKGLRCYCSEKNVVAWVSNDDPVIACDARERLIKEENDNVR